MSRTPHHPPAFTASRPPGAGRRTRRVGLAAVAALVVALVPGVAAADEPGATNTITDVAGILVGHETRTGDGWQTGTTVVRSDGEAATASSTTYGGAPGTRETDLLEPGGLVTAADAIVLSGGSAYGLDAASGAMQWLEEQGQGYNVGQGVVPIVPSAILFDLGRGGDFQARPDASFGYSAAAAADGGPVEMGRVGAGTGASWGLGSASVVTDDGWTVGAIVGLNPGGSPVDPGTCLPYGVFLELDDEFNLRTPNRRECPDQRRRPRPAAEGGVEGEPFNTTIAVVATDAPLDQTQAQRMSMIANSGLSRSIRPVHNMFDGDTVFALATTPSDGSLSSGDLNRLYNAAADTLGRAVVHAVLQGETLDNRIAYCEQYPRVCRGYPGDGASGTSDSTTGAAVAVPPQPPTSVLAPAPAGVEVDALPASRSTGGAVLAVVAVLVLAMMASRLRSRHSQAAAA